MARQRKKIDYYQDLMNQKSGENYRVCDCEGCDKKGEYRAPKDNTLSDYYWFCLEHVKEYNAKWNFYEGMDEEQIETERKEDVCWHRPTWVFGQNRLNPDNFSDPLGVKKEAFSSDNFEQTKQSAMAKIDAKLLAAANVLELDFPLELKKVRENYKRLAKQHHPDSNGGDKSSEEKFKDISEAYSLIMQSFEA